MLKQLEERCLMKISIFRNNRIYSILILFFLWHIGSLFYSEIILPSPLKTFKKLFFIASQGSFFSHIGFTVIRMIKGFFWSVYIGSLIGILSGLNKKVKVFFNPFLNVSQSVPPISWLALAMIWFGLEGNATVFIIFIGCFPMIAINIGEGIESIDYKLIEMGKSFNFSRWKILWEIIIPSMKVYFKSVLSSILGVAWKITIMGEVLSSCNGIGAQIAEGRLNIETDTVLAWSLIIIFLCHLSQKITDFLFGYGKLRRKKYVVGNERCKKEDKKYIYT